MFNRDADIGDELVGTEGEERAALTHIHGGCSSVTKSRLTLCDTRDLAHQTRLPLGFPGQEYQSGSPSPPPGDLPAPRTEPSSPASPALQTGP